jgi:diguanylate cyclase (GGDEF)-like protein/PAS domain S-box-containing protein
VAAVAALLFEDGGFADHRAPAALVDATGRLRAHNDAGAVLAAALGRGTPLGRLVGEVVATGAAIEDRVALAEPGGAGAPLELSALPIAGGAAVLLLGRDGDYERRLRGALVESRARYKALVELSSDFVWETDEAGCFAFVSPGGALGYAPEALVARRPETLFVEPQPMAGASPFDAAEPVADIDMWLKRADGATAWVVVSSAPVLDAQGRWCGARGICRDVTAARARDAALARAENRERLIAHIIRTIGEEIDADAMLSAAVTAIAMAFGALDCRIYRVAAGGGLDMAARYGQGDVPGVLEAEIAGRLARISAPDAAPENAERLLCIPSTYHARLNGAVVIARAGDALPWQDDERVLAGEIAAQIAFAIEQIENMAKLEALSRTDELTGLLNRRAFLAELDGRMRRAGPRAAPAALLYIDLDNFKLVNDRAGHQEGDAALRAVARLLTGNTRPGDLVARLGGDEFALWLERTDEAAATAKAAALLEAAAALRDFTGDAARPLGLSIGIAVQAGGGAETVAALTDRADQAMYRIKHGGKGGYVVAAPASRSAA